MRRAARAFFFFFCVCVCVKKVLLLLPPLSFIEIRCCCVVIDCFRAAWTRRQRRFEAVNVQK